MADEGRKAATIPGGDVTTTTRLPSVTIKAATKTFTQSTLCVIECEDCGWSERVNVSDAPRGYADRTADKHRCNG